MQKAEPQGLDVTAQIGLYGELRFLHDHVISSLGPEREVKSWTGPAGAPQDFQCGALAIDVKTTAADHLLLRISNALQLDDSTIDALYLMHLAVDRRNSFGQTLVELVELIKTGIASDVSASEMFSTRLLQAGIMIFTRNFTVVLAMSIDRSDFTGSAMVFLASCCTVPNGLRDIRYSIELSAIDSYGVPVKQIVDSLTEVEKWATQSN